MPQHNKIDDTAREREKKTRRNNPGAYTNSAGKVKKTGENSLAAY